MIILKELIKFLDFSKIPFIKEIDILNKSNLDTSSIIYYNPKYTLFEARSPEVSFTNINIILFKIIKNIYLKNYGFL